MKDEEKYIFIQAVGIRYHLSKDVFGKHLQPLNESLNTSRGRVWRERSSCSWESNSEGDEVGIEGDCERCPVYRHREGTVWFERQTSDGRQTEGKVEKRSVDAGRRRRTETKTSLVNRWVHQFCICSLKFESAVEIIRISSSKGIWTSFNCSQSFAVNVHCSFNLAFALLSFSSMIARSRNRAMCASGVESGVVGDEW